MTEKENRRLTQPPASLMNPDAEQSSGYCRQLQLRREASQRLPGGDPWYDPNWPTALASSYEDAAAHLLDHGLMPAPDREGLHLLWRKGGHHRQVAEAIAERWGLVA